MSAPRDFQSQQSLSDMDFLFDDSGGIESPFFDWAPVDEPQTTFASAKVVPANAQGALLHANENAVFYQAVSPALDGPVIDWNQ